ncbi:MAG: efflux RND transporter periplasmic adaptor subunit [Candidatus Krumholzibacteriia bacterium]
MFRNRMTIILCILPALALVGCQAAPEGEAAPEVARNVRVMALETSPVTQYLELAGPVVPVRGAAISSEESGTLDRIVHDKGERVAAGEPLLLLDRRVLAAELDAAEAQLALQQYNHDRMVQLRAAGKVSELDLLQSAAQLAAARGQRDVARTRHDRAGIKAPFAGIVADRYVEPGELVAPGMPVARVIDPTC